MIIAIYARKSKFTGKGDSIENQIQLCREYIETHFPNTEIITYIDEGFSGGNSDRPEFQRLIKDARNNKFDILLCYRLDRISRSIMDFSSTMETLTENNIDFVSIKEQFDTSTPIGRAMMYISSVFAQLERETIAERIKDNLLKLARTGRWLGGKPPTGYRGERHQYLDENMQKRSYNILMPIEEELELVRTIFNQYLKLKSISQLHSWTLTNSIKSKNGKDFDMVALKAMLTNTVYVKSDEYLFEWFEKRGYDIANTKKEYNGNGVFTYNKYQNRKNKAHKIRDISEQIVAVANHKGVIDSKEWVQVQESLGENSKKAPRIGTGDNGLISPILYCTYCGTKMKISLKYTDGEVKHYYYKCRLKENSRGVRCTNKNLNGLNADEFVVKALKELYFGEGMLSEQLKLKKSKAKNLSKENSIIIAKIENEIEKSNKSIQNLTIQLSENLNSTASKYIIQQIETLDKKINDFKIEINKYLNENSYQLLQKENINILEESIKRFNSQFDDADIFEKRKMIQAILKRIEWNGEVLDLYLR